MGYERMLDKAHRPSEEDILSTIGKTGAWLKLLRLKRRPNRVVSE